MDMQDKDFDKVFSSKFEDFEAEPSPMIWGNIAAELDGKKAGRPRAGYLSIAAGIVVVLTAGWLLLQKGSQTAEKHHNYANLVNKDTVKPVSQPAIAVVQKQQEPSVIEKTPEGKVVSISKHQPKTFPIAKAAVPVVNDVDKALGPVNANQQIVAQAVTPATTDIKPVVPDVQLTPKTADVIAAVPTEKTGDIASAEKEPDEPVKRHSIHNLGGLINALVEKVDKRADKIIEFSDGADDDAETSITGLNVGPIKFKKQ